jgi:hypothetical protein
MVVAAALFLWVEHIAGRWAATFAGAVFACMPTMIQMAQFGRFYALHALTTGIAALLIYYACQARGQRLAWLVAGAVASLALSMHLQSTTLIAICALGAWVAGVLIAQYARSARPKRTKALVIAGGAVAALVLAAVVGISDLGVGLWNEFRATTLWGSVPGRADNVRFYHQVLEYNFGILWWLFPIATVVAIVGRRREMLFAAVFVAITLGLHSLAGQKDERYVFYVVPAIAALLGVGLAGALSGYLQWARNSLPSLVGARVAPHALGIGAVGLVALSAAFAFVNNPPFVDVLRMLAGAPKVERLDYSWIANWPAEVDALRPLVQQPRILVTSSGMKSIYYFGDYDFELNANVTDETDTRRDFGIDPRTGRQAIASREAVELLLQCYRDVVFVIDESRWSRDTAVPVAASELIESRAARIPTNPDSALLAFHATNSSSSPTAEFCKQLRPGRRS